MTPLEMATFGNHNETADLLRKHGGKTGVELKAAGEVGYGAAQGARLKPCIRGS
jgi:hypothetical protein